MITLNASGGSVTFTFSGNSTYLNDGTITVPVNSLALIIDESDMATFRKAASNDIFVSANVSEFGMAKAELESWFKENAVGSTGGGGGDITSGEVQTMIDESISGKADSSAVTEEISAAVSGKIETNTYTAYTANTQTVLNSKLDATAYTPVQVSTAITENDTNAVAGGAVYDKVHVTSGNGSTTLLTLEEPTGPSPWYMASNYPSGVTKFNIELNLASNWSGELYWVDESNTKYYGLLTNIGGSLSFSAYTGGSYNSFTAVTSQTDNIISIEITELSGGATSGLTAFGIRETIIAAVVNAYAVEGESVEYWIKDYVDAKVAEVGGGCEVSSAITSGDTNAVAGGAVYDKVHVTSGNGSTTLLTFGSETIPGSGFISAATNYQSGVTKFNIELDLTQWGRWSPILGFYDSNNNNYAGQIINTDGVITYADRSDTMFGTSMSATTSYTNNVFTIEVTGLSGDAPSGLTMFGLANMEPVVNAYAIEGESVEYWIKDYVDAKVAEAGGGECTVEETVIYNRYTSPYYDYDGGNKVTYAVLDYLGDKSTTYDTQFFFNVGDSSTEYESWMTFDYVNHSANTESLSDYVTVEYVSDIQDFKVSIATDYQSDWWIRQIAGLDSDKNALVPFYTINSGSPCTVISTDVVGLVKKVKDIAEASVSDSNIYAQKDNIYFYLQRTNGQTSSNYINLEDLDGSNNTLKPNINIPLGVSGWTEVDFNGSSCQYGNGSPLGFTTFRISGDTNELTYWGLQIAAGWESEYDWDTIQWDGNNFVRTTNRSDDVFSAATVTWDSNTGYLTIAYPTAVTVNDEVKQTGLFMINSSGCYYGTIITKLEYYAEQTQPLKPYVQETRAALGGLKLSHVTQAQYDAMEQGGTLDSNTLYVITDN